MPAASTGLAHVTISAPHRRVDVALPDSVPLAELQAELLRHAGEALPDQGQRHGGWLLRRADGTPLSPATGLAGQGVRDGSVLHLVPAGEQWPELEYDDVVEAIADGARRYGLGWSPLATRVAALVAAALALAIGLLAQLRGGSAVVALVIAFALLLCGTAASRAYGDAALGTVLAGGGLPYAFVGGRQLVGGAHADALLSGSALLLLASVLAAIGVAHLLRIFVAGATAGLLGAIGALLTWLTTSQGAAAAVLAGLVAGVAAVPLLAIRLGKLPMPSLNLPAAGQPAGNPDRARVFAAVARTDEMLTGMLGGVAVIAVCASYLLVRTGDVASWVLVAVAAAAFLLRARLFVTIRQRLPLVGSGLAGFGLLAISAVLDGGGALATVFAVLLAAVGLAVALAGSYYSVTPPSPYLGRAADLLDVLCVVAVIPIAAGVLGLYGLAAELVS